MYDLKEVLPEFLKELMSIEDEDSWDCPPMVFVVFVPQEETGEKMRFHLMDTQPIFDMFANQLTVPEVIARMGMGLGAMSFPTPWDKQFAGEKGALAVVLRNEGWGLSDKDVPRGDIEAWADSGKRIVEHPAAFETRAYCAYSPETGHISISQRRHEEPMPMEGYEGNLAEAMEILWDGVSTRWPVVV